MGRELGYYAREGVTVEVIYTEDQEPQIADFIAGKYDLIVAIDTYSRVAMAKLYD